MKQILIAIVVIVCVFGAMRVTNKLVQSHRPWKEEPDSFLGVRLGAPITDSLRPCDAKQVVCYQWLTDPIKLGNTPGELGDVFVEQLDGKAVSMNTRFDGDLPLWHLEERFGQPQEGGIDSGDAEWIGNKVHLRVSKGRDSTHYLTFELREIDRPAPKNPF